MNKKAFTLIELLAVIVILAIIALIAVPIVINIINDSKEESKKRSLNLYMKQVESSITKENLNEKFDPSICLIQDDSKLICDDKEVNITINGEKPKEGTILLENGKIIKYKNIKLGNLYYHKDLEGNETITKEKLPGICRTDNEASTELGTKYECDVNNEKTFTFYVLSKDRYNVNLIMNNNICFNGEQATSNNQCKRSWRSVDSSTSYSKYGPTSAMNGLYNATKNWTNVPDMIMDYKDENFLNDFGYDGIKTKNKITTIYGKNGATNTTIGTIEEPLKARLPMLSETKNAGCDILSDENPTAHFTCPVWLVENLRYYNTTNNLGYDKYEINKDLGMNETFGYWLLSSAYGIQSYVVEYSISTSSVTDHSNSGVRPVITITMDELVVKN